MSLARFLRSHRLETLNSSRGILYASCLTDQEKHGTSAPQWKLKNTSLSACFDIIFLSGASFIERLTITVIYNVKLQQGFVFLQEM